MDETGRTEHVPYARVTVAEAAAILGVNVVTIRRMIKRGQLEGERVHRPQGSAYLVTLPADATPPSEDGTPTEQPAQDVSRTDGTPAGLMAAWSEAFLVPLVARLGEQEAVIRDQAETIGRTTAELERAASTVVALGDQLAAADRGRQRDVRRLSIVLAVVCALLLVAGTLAAAGWARWLL